ncbi:MAG: hypothetical protein NT159_25080 [Proteobacteria bacterium]|nr:hypothetical protein [Pseudomonadota bacterium]
MREGNDQTRFEAIAEDFPEPRFQGLLGDCGEEEQPGIEDLKEWRDWSQIKTSRDQLRIERRLLDFVNSDSRILHVGIGNSRLAKRFAHRVRGIVGMSVSPAEIARGQALAISNYEVLQWNKYRYWNDPSGEGFDAIVDNNPTGFACCLKHLSTMLAWYADALRPQGAIFTDRVGLGWVVSTPGVDRRWRGFDLEDCAVMGARLGLHAIDIDGSVYALVKKAGRGRIGQLERYRHWPPPLRGWLSRVESSVTVRTLNEDRG